MFGAFNSFGQMGAVQAPDSVSLIDPSTLGLHLWYDPSDISSLFQDTAKTTAVSADGDVVGALVNKGSAGTTLDALQATTSKKPLYKTSGSLKFVLSDGVDDLLATTGNSTSAITTSTFDIFAAFRYVSIPGTNADATAYSNPAVLTDTGAWLELTARNTPTLQAGIFSAAQATASISNAAFAAGTDVVARMQLSGGTLSLWLNKTLTATVASGNVGGATPFKMFTTGGSASFASIRNYGLMSRKTVFSSTDSDAIWTYLGAKIGISL